MNEFILNIDNKIKESQEKFNHAAKVIVQDTKWDQLTSILDKLSAYKQILFPLAYGSMNQSIFRERYETISHLYDIVSECKSNMLLDANTDYERSRSIRKQTTIKKGII